MLKRTQQQVQERSGDDGGFHLEHVESKGGQDKPVKTVTEEANALLSSGVQGREPRGGMNLRLQRATEIRK